MDRKRRQMLHYAQRAGYECRAAGAESLPEFYRLFCLSMRQHGTPPYPQRFLNAILECLPSNLFFVYHQGVANTIKSGVVASTAITNADVTAGLLSAITWNLITWYYGIPSSSSHALVRGYAGAAVEKGGTDVWYTADPKEFLAPDYEPANYHKVNDILDVWFDSGSTHAFVLEKRPELQWPASLYLEGSDQHRGWFQSSLLESCGTRGRAPYDAVLTHGFINDEQGRKMSKSLGNTVAPQQVIEQFVGQGLG
jgi:hypothetical protein